MECPICKGDGVVYEDEFEYGRRVKGTNEVPCEKCEGTGKIEE